MRIFYSEVGRGSGTFSFAYYPTALLEPGDRLADLYQAGFLPFSTLDHDRVGNFFMARQVRIDLGRFELSSENRRVYEKFSGKLEGSDVPIAEFNTHDRDFVKFCLDYFTERHGPEVMPEERLRFMLDGGLLNKISVYRFNGRPFGTAPLDKTRDKQDRPVAYVFLVDFGESGAHFWYSFYDLAYVQQSLGLWLMTDVALRMQRGGKQYLYLGTAFGEKGLYKTNFEQIEWWDGECWNPSRDKLRKRCKTDDERFLGLTNK